MRRLRSDRGLTLVELMVTIALISMLGVVVTFGMVALHKTSRTSTGLLDQTLATRRPMDIVSAELRTATSVNGAGFVSAQDSSVEFYAAVNASVGPTKIKYAVEAAGSKLVLARYAIVPTGAPDNPVYNQASQVRTVLMSDVSSAAAPYFKYVDKTQATTTTAPAFLTTPVSTLTQIGAVQVSLAAIASNVSAPNVFTNKVTLENLLPRKVNS
jgi:prepilin-type N-terminal cleavage/methylation domain-containing protein